MKKSIKTAFILKKLKLSWKNKNLRLFVLLFILFFTVITVTIAYFGFKNNLRLLTEDYPPITFSQNGKVTGYATEIVEEILKRQNQKKKIELMDWATAYDIALKKPNIVLFSTTRTQKRENLFKWLGPIGSYNDLLYANKNSSLIITSLAEAKKIPKIGVVSSWFSTDFLKENQFPNLEETSRPTENAEKLITGQVNLCAFTDMTAPGILREAGYSIYDIRPVFKIKKYEFYITFSKKTPDKIVRKWQQIFQQMAEDGTLKKLQARWTIGQ